jgi:hypothetical protein
VAEQAGGRSAGAGRTSGFAAAVWEMVRQVPEGRATTYGQLAEEVVPLTLDRRVDWARCGGPWSPAQRPDGNR